MQVVIFLRHQSVMLPNISEFFVLSYNFCNCTGLALSENEECGDNWLTRLVGSTDTESKYREPLLKAASTWAY